MLYIIMLYIHVSPMLYILCYTLWSLMLHWRHIPLKKIFTHPCQKIDVKIGQSLSQLSNNLEKTPTYFKMYTNLVYPKPAWNPLHKVLITTHPYPECRQSWSTQNKPAWTPFSQSANTTHPYPEYRQSWSAPARSPVQQGRDTSSQPRRVCKREGSEGLR